MRYRALAIVGALAAALAAPSWAQSVTMGETAILSATDSQNGNLLLAQQATLSEPATLQSLSFYVSSVAGSLRLGVYDSTGPGGGPGALLAQTAGATAVKGWNTHPTMTQPTLPAGTYWLAYLPSSNALSFRKENNTGIFSQGEQHRQLLLLRLQIRCDASDVLDSVSQLRADGLVVLCNSRWRTPTSAADADWGIVYSFFAIAS